MECPGQPAAPAGGLVISLSFRYSSRASTARSGDNFELSSLISGFTGGSYGDPIPVKFSIS